MNMAPLSELGVNLPPVARVDGRWRRAGGPEWDGWYQLDGRTRDRIRRRFMVAKGRTGYAPDQAADVCGCESVDALWVELARLARAVRDPRDGRALDVAHPSELVGPAEVARMLGVSVATVHQWVHRRLTPVPWWEESGYRIWRRDEVEAWGLATGRLSRDQPAEVF